MKFLPAILWFMNWTPVSSLCAIIAREGKKTIIMKIQTIIEKLRRPSAYLHSAESIEVFQTHISVVFLAGDFAYKTKKPPELGFLDYSTLEKRLHFCREEVRLSRRLAPDVYLGVVPILHQHGSVVVEERSIYESEGRPRNNIAEYAVKMKRRRMSALSGHFWNGGNLRKNCWTVLQRSLLTFTVRLISSKKFPESVTGR